MGFLNDLGKGVIRSAVNQVGRDAGRVVSNQLYGDAHSTPYRRAGYESKCFIDESSEEVLYEQYKTQNFLFHCLIAFLFNVAGGIALLLYSLNLRKKANIVRGKRFLTYKTYVTDNRYKDGLRYNGNITRSIPFVRAANDEQMEKNKKVARNYLIAGIVLIIYGVILWTVAYLK